MDLIERFRYIMKLNNLTASAFANKIGVQPSSVSHILSGRNKPSLEFIQKILKAYPKVDSNWLINGTANVSKNIIQEKDEKNPKEVVKELVAEESHVQEREVVLDKKREIARVLIFFTDGTFEEFNSKAI